eukprot:3933737-Prymnesium_polylepis.1
METSSYETLQWTSAQVATVQMGQRVSSLSGCDWYSQLWPATTRALSLIGTQHPGISTQVDHIEFW